MHACKPTFSSSKRRNDILSLPIHLQAIFINLRDQLAQSLPDPDVKRLALPQHFSHKGPAELRFVRVAKVFLHSLSQRVDSATHLPHVVCAKELFERGSGMAGPRGEGGG